MSKIIYDVIQRFEVENGVPRLVSTNIQVIEGGEDLMSLAISMLDKLGFYDKFEEKRTSQYIGYRLKNPGKGAKRYQLVLAQRKEGLCISIPQYTLKPYLLKLNFLINFSTQQLSKFKNLVKLDHTISRAYWIIPSKKNVFIELSKQYREILGNQLVGDFEFICNSIVSFEHEMSDLDIYKFDLNHNNSLENLIKYHQEYVTNHTLLKSLDNSDCCLKIGINDIDKLFNYAYQVSISSSEVVKEFLGYFAKILMEQQ
ncbi:hypothetical protein NIES4075_20610 [Tolypothrix sp. NIES-4075]|uniref:hypothetical protein n=1 Tax=Tolypothrix sp. NIES-4075 TaxID=2005459 RepID=UPI000B5C2F36|nr:hypothetical protein [Tolypothrix sp. NIES-4075]GAX41092.1 hypothetical protein NIES4075_20610 [Tolypothrix sp. NIES-4075]